MTADHKETRTNIRKYFILLEIRLIGLHFAADNISLSLLKFLQLASEILSISARMTFRPFTVIQGHWCCTNWNHVCDFLCVRSSNIGPILHRFRDFAAFMCSWPQPYSTLILGLLPLHQIAQIRVIVNSDLKLFGSDYYFQSIPNCVKNIPQRHRRTDIQADGETTCNLTTALCIASRGNKIICHVQCLVSVTKIVTWFMDRFSPNLEYSMVH